MIKKIKKKTENFQKRNQKNRNFKTPKKTILRKLTKKLKQNRNKK
jgi:hypothetical protein